MVTPNFSTFEQAGLGLIMLFDARSYEPGPGVASSIYSTESSKRSSVRAVGSSLLVLTLLVLKGMIYLYLLLLILKLAASSIGYEAS